ncbi:hypothetical protein ZWY2020_045885 [Hordeum vulgare]|nr:hypothetical protein ZWY2020_045885 [Hordeum vulgare]
MPSRSPYSDAAAFALPPLTSNPTLALPHSRMSSPWPCLCCSCARSARSSRSSPARPQPRPARQQEELAIARELAHPARPRPATQQEELPHVGRPHHVGMLPLADLLQKHAVAWWSVAGNKFGKFDYKKEHTYQSYQAEVNDKPLAALKQYPCLGLQEVSTMKVIVLVIMAMVIIDSCACVRPRNIKENTMLVKDMRKLTSSSINGRSTPAGEKQISHFALSDN